MKTLYRWILLMALICAALGFYSYGSVTGAFVFIMLGLLFEAAFWFKLFKPNGKGESA